MFYTMQCVNMCIYTYDTVHIKFMLHSRRNRTRKTTHIEYCLNISVYARVSVTLVQFLTRICISGDHARAFCQIV